MYYVLAVLGILVTIGLIIVLVAPLRRLLLTSLLFRWYKRVLPPMSSTEREAIYAGDTWHEADLFQGNPKWDELLAVPKPSLSTKERDFIETKVTKLCSMIDDWQITHHDLDTSPEIWEYIQDNGFFGLHIPEEYGGQNFSALASSIIVQKIASKSLSVAVTVMVPNSLGPGELLLKYGTDEQRQQYLHKLANGKEIPCFGLTAPNAGSDASAITDNGIVTRCDYNGEKNVLGLRLNFHKHYITLAPKATIIGLAVKLFDPDRLLGGDEELGITVVLVPRDVKGMDIGKRHFPLNQAFMNGPIRGKDVFVPMDAIIGGQDRIGDGWKMLVECLAAGRGISLPAISMATGKHCFAATGAYAKVRKQFNVSIGKFEGVGAALSEIGGYTYILESMGLLTLTALDIGRKPSVITAISKYHTTELARKVINHAMDIHGGRGIQLGPRNYLGRYYEGIPVGITVEGANILTRCLMIFGQGAIRCHPYVLAEMNAVAKDSLTEFDKEMSSHMLYVFKNFAKLKWHALTGTIFCKKAKGTKWGWYYRQLSFLSLGLAVSADISMLLMGGALKRKENISARLGDVLSYLYIASAILKYNNDNGNTKDDAIYTTWALDYCLNKIHEAYLYYCKNFPNRIVATVLQWIIIPPWRTYLLPKDKVSMQMADNMMNPSELRDRLSEHCIETNIEPVWRKMIEVEPLLKKIDDQVRQNLIKKKIPYADKIKKAVQHGVITSTDASLLEEFEIMRFEAMQVDEFDNAELMRKK